MKLFNLFTLILILAILALPVAAQGDTASTELPEWAVGLPAVLSTLTAINFAATDMFKRWLANPALPFSPAPQTRSMLVVAFSLTVGVLSVLATPEAISFLPDSYFIHPAMRYFAAGVSVSVLGGVFYEVKTRLAPVTNAPTLPEAKG